MEQRSFSSHTNFFSSIQPYKNMQRDENQYIFQFNFTYFCHVTWYSIVLQENLIKKYNFFFNFYTYLCWMLEFSIYNPTNDFFLLPYFKIYKNSLRWWIWRNNGIFRNKLYKEMCELERKRQTKHMSFDMSHLEFTCAPLFRVPFYK